MTVQLGTSAPKTAERTKVAMMGMEVTAKKEMMMLEWKHIEAEEVMMVGVKVKCSLSNKSPRPR